MDLNQGNRLICNSKDILSLEIAQDVLLAESGNDLLSSPHANVKIFSSNIDENPDDYPSDAITFGNSGPLNGLPYNDHNYIYDSSKAPAKSEQSYNKLALLANVALDKKAPQTSNSIALPNNTANTQSNLTTKFSNNFFSVSNPNIFLNNNSKESNNCNIQILSLKNGVSLLRSPYVLNTHLSIQKDDSIRCICGYTHDDGYLVNCDKCNMNQHVECVSPYGDGSVPSPYFCDICQPRQMRYAESVCLQREKLAIMQQNIGGSQNFVNTNALRFPQFNGRVSTSGPKHIFLTTSDPSTSKIRLTISQGFKSNLNKPSNSFNCLKTTPPFSMSVYPSGNIRSSKRKQDLVTHHTIVNNLSTQGSNGLSPKIHDSSTRQNGLYSIARKGHAHSGTQDKQINNILTDDSPFRELIDQIRISKRAKSRLMLLNSELGNSYSQNINRTILRRLASNPKCSLANFEFNNKILISSENLLANEPIIEYSGLLSLAEEYSEQYDFRKHFEPHVLFYSNWDRMNLLMDARECGNAARYIRRSCDPNCEIRHLVVAQCPDDPLDSNGYLAIKCVRLVVYSTKFIPNLTELTIPFDFDWSKCRYSVSCACNTQNCLLNSILRKQPTLSNEKTITTNGLHGKFEFDGTQRLSGIYGYGKRGRKGYLACRSSRVLIKAKQQRNHQSRLAASVIRRLNEASINSNKSHAAQKKMLQMAHFKRQKRTMIHESNDVLIPCKKKKILNRKSEINAGFNSPILSHEHKEKEDACKDRNDYWLTEVMNRIERMERKEKRRKSGANEPLKSELKPESTLDALADIAIADVNLNAFSAHTMPTSPSYLQPKEKEDDKDIKPSKTIGKNTNSFTPKSPTQAKQPRSRRASGTPVDLKSADFTSESREDRWLRTQLQRIKEMEAPLETLSKKTTGTMKKSRSNRPSTSVDYKSDPDSVFTCKSVEHSISLPLSHEIEGSGSQQCKLIVYKARESDPMAKFSRSRSHTAVSNMQINESNDFNSDKPTKKRWLTQALLEDKGDLETPKQDESTYRPGTSLLPPSGLDLHEEFVSNIVPDNAQVLNPKKRYISEISLVQLQDNSDAIQSTKLPPKKRQSQSSLGNSNIDKDLSLLSSLASSLLPSEDTNEITPVQSPMLSDDPPIPSDTSESKQHDLEFSKKDYVRPKLKLSWSDYCRRQNTNGVRKNGITAELEENRTESVCTNDQQSLSPGQLKFDDLVALPSLDPNKVGNYLKSAVPRSVIEPKIYPKIPSYEEKKVYDSVGSIKERDRPNEDCRETNSSSYFNRRSYTHKNISNSIKNDRYRERSYHSSTFDKYHYRPHRVHASSSNNTYRYPYSSGKKSPGQRHISASPAHGSHSR